MMCFEVLVAGLPSAVLSLQPNNERVQGKFFAYVLCHALPASITMVLAVIAVYLASLLQFNGVFTQEYTALAVLAVTFTGTVMLSFLCRPFNALRLGTFLGSVCLCAAVFLFPVTAGMVVSGWPDVQFSVTEIILLLCVLLCTYPVYALLLKLFQKIERALNR